METRNGNSNEEIRIGEKQTQVPSQTDIHTANDKMSFPAPFHYVNQPRPIFRPHPVFHSGAFLYLVQPVIQECPYMQCNCCAMQLAVGEPRPVYPIWSPPSYARDQSNCNSTLEAEFPEEPRQNEPSPYSTRCEDVAKQRQGSSQAPLLEEPVMGATGSKDPSQPEVGVPEEPRLMETRAGLQEELYYPPTPSPRYVYRINPNETRQPFPGLYYPQPFLQRPPYIPAYSTRTNTEKFGE